MEFLREGRKTHRRTEREIENEKGGERIYLY
jgi:hypothetical protein